MATSHLPKNVKIPKVTAEAVLLSWATHRTRGRPVMLHGVKEALNAAVRIVTNLDTSQKSIATSLDEPSSLAAVNLAIEAKEKELEIVMAEEPESVFQLIDRGRRADVLNFQLNQLKYRREHEDAELYKAKKNFPALADLADDVLADYEKALTLSELSKTRTELAKTITSVRTHKRRIEQLKHRLAAEKTSSIGDSDTSSESVQDASNESTSDDEPIADAKGWQNLPKKRFKFAKRGGVVPPKKADNGSRAL